MNYDHDVMLSRKDQIALVVSVFAGAGIVFLFKYAGAAAMYLLFGFQLFVVPFIIRISDRLSLITWQACILTTVICLALRIWLVAGGEPGIELLKMAFVFWAVGTILSSPVPLRRLWLRTDKSKHVGFLTLTGICIVTLLVLVELITR